MSRAAVTETRRAGAGPGALGALGAFGLWGSGEGLERPPARPWGGRARA